MLFVILEQKSILVHCVAFRYISGMKRTSPFDSVEKLKAQKKSKKKYNIAWQYYGKEVKGMSPLMYLDGPDISPSEKIAAFDMDGALILTKSGKTFPTGPDDWKLFNNKVSSKLASLNSEGYKIILFSNQAGIEKKKTKPDDIQKKVLAIMDELGFPFQMFISTGENIYRKPGTAGWKFMLDKCNGGKKCSLKDSFYVGDAAGRIKNWQPQKKKDFSCSDRKFAANVGIKFQTPEEFFNGDKECLKYEWGSLDPETFLSSSKVSTSYDSITSKNTEMVIFVGFPASGKSTFSKTYMQPKNYVIINRDELKTQEKCLKVCSESLKTKKSVVIDNTNPSKESRQSYIALAKKHSVPVRCFHFQASKEVAEHMNQFRQAQSGGKIRRIPAIGYNLFKSKFETPDVSEGFSEIKKIDFLPNFKTDEDKELFLQWT